MNYNTVQPPPTSHATSTNDGARSEDNKVDDPHILTKFPVSISTRADHIKYFLSILPLFCQLPAPC